MGLSIDHTCSMFCYKEMAVYIAFQKGTLYTVADKKGEIIT